MFNRFRFLRVGVTSVELAIIASLVVLSSPILVAQQPRELLDRAVADFERGRISESAAGFDALIKVRPDVAPELWQRGITLYYAGRFADCRAQFESHRTVNPNDVENAAWHFLCVARAESPAKAKAALLPVGPDARVPMRQVYDLFRGVLTPEAVLKAAGSQPSGSVLRPAVPRALLRGPRRRPPRTRAHHRGGCRSLRRCRRLHAHRGEGPSRTPAAATARRPVTAFVTTKATKTTSEGHESRDASAAASFSRVAFS